MMEPAEAWPRNGDCRGLYDESEEMCRDKCNKVEQCMKLQEMGYNPLEEALDEEKHKDLKIEINELIWRHGPGHLTLDQAEKIALKMLKMIVEGTDAS